MKTDIYNLIILDESGSMSGVTKQTISGCNETINTIRAAGEQYAETQNQYVSIYAFQSGGSKPSRYLVKNEPAAEVKHIDADSYQPCGCTPLYDAVGSTLIDLKMTIDQKDLAIGSVTIITDGYENSSRHYSREKVVKMIDALKEIGWNFNFIGANINVEETASALHMDSALSFDNDEEGTEIMFANQNKGRMRFYSRADKVGKMCDAAPTSTEETYKMLREDADKYFDEDENGNEGGESKKGKKDDKNRK